MEPEIPQNFEFAELTIQFGGFVNAKFYMDVDGTICVEKTYDIDKGKWLPHVEYQAKAGMNELKWELGGGVEMYRLRWGAC